MTDKLSPCPLCGGAARHKFDPAYSFDTAHYSIECSGCGLSLYASPVLNDIDLARWNRRSQAPQNLSLSAKIVEFFEAHNREWGKLSEPAQELLDAARSVCKSPESDGPLTRLADLDLVGLDCELSTLRERMDGQPNIDMTAIDRHQLDKISDAVRVLYEIHDHFVAPPGEQGVSQ